MVKNIALKLIIALQDRKGVSALEYGILAATIIGVVAAAVATLGTDLSSLFSTIGSKISSAVT
jgi:pilus assembly protein Flp/PilA